MIIKYESKFLLNICENKKIFEKEFQDISFIQFIKAIIYITNSKNIAKVQKNKGLRIKKLKKLKNIGSFRINEKWRVNFKFENPKNFLEEKEITITEIHPHKY